MSKKSDARRAKENENLFKIMNEQLEALAKIRNDAETTNDPAEKILLLRELDFQIWNSDRSFTSFEYSLAEKRARRSGRTYLKYGTSALAGLITVVGGGILLGVLIQDGADAFTSVKSREREQKKLRAIPEVASALKELEEHKKAVAQLLEDAVSKSDLKALSESPHFHKAYKAHEPLRDRFEAAAAARAALGEVAQDDTPQTKENPAPAAKPQRVGSYDNLKNKV